MPVAGVAAMMAGEIGLGFTLMINLVGMPAQLTPAVRKLPNEPATLPIAQVEITALLAVLMAETLPDPSFVTYNRLPSALTDTPIGVAPAIVAATVLVVVLITEILLDCKFATYTRVPSRPTEIPVG